MTNPPFDSQIADNVHVGLTYVYTVLLIVLFLFFHGKSTTRAIHNICNMFVDRDGEMTRKKKKNQNLRFSLELYNIYSIDPKEPIH